jgi:uncharacterized protein (DUF2062 family)
VRANVAIAAAVTLIINPLTIPPLYYAAYRVGSWELHHDAAVVNPAAGMRCIRPGPWLQPGKPSNEPLRHPSQYNSARL